MKRTADNAFRKECISEEHILEVEGLRVSYDHHRSGLLAKEGKTEVLHGVSFFIQRGEVLGLVGESGCGKSTLSRAILGLLPDYEGTIRCAAKMPQMVFQDPYSSLNPAKKVGWILEEPLRLTFHAGAGGTGRKNSRPFSQAAIRRSAPARLYRGKPDAGAGASHRG